ncbi:response regulator transcription factor [Clostridium thermosuccinogenes]|uniref:response regulator transcription factor n=1 Tax=Clostridium thermosuccinogenes TaxID=84032 RepID=UPI000CCC68B2|nr:response regulator [Pseudoclostridium thermosuccinogenes]PNT90775.1 hypothetical protein CDQ83_13045 [Pseudoclostridium thermosuccinogenes]
MYRIMIVDDEEIMRDGLKSLVNWESLGFQIAADFEDGQEALEYLKNNEVDVILTDIKMTFVSGLDLARYVNDQKLSTKVVLISGYKDFEYARQAVNYNVVQYLLKPISLKDVNRVFAEIRMKIDREKELQKRQEDYQKKFNELISFMRDQFFTDLVLGALKDRNEMNKRLEMLDLNLDAENSPCCLWTATIDRYEEFINENWQYGKDAFCKTITNIFCSARSELKYQFINRREGKFKILIIGTPNISETDFIKKIESDIEYAKNNAEKLLGIKLGSYHTDFYETLYDLAINRPKRIKDELESINYKDINEDIEEHLLDQQKLLMTHVLNGNRESVFSLMEQISKETEPLGIKQRVKFLTDLFNILLNQLQINQIDISKLMKNSWTDFSDLNLSNPEEFKKMLFMKLDNILQSIKGDEEQPDSIIISHIKEYIHENYNKDITLEQIADHVFLSPVYVSRLFKEKTGENFSDYLVKVRMEKALKLLEEPRYKVYEVGYEIGYMSTKYFYKLFKKYYGCTPTEYRKNLFFLKRKGD